MQDSFGALHKVTVFINNTSRWLKGQLHMSFLAHIFHKANSSGPRIKRQTSFVYGLDMAKKFKLIASKM